MEEADSFVSSETAKELDEEREVDNLKKIEAALFLSARFLSLQELVMLTDVNPLMLKELLERLVGKYNCDDSAIEIVVKNNMWKMDVGQEYVDMINKLATGSSEFTKAEQETLAVISYKQPVKQSVIINIRGNKAYDHIKKFVEVGLVIAKRAGHTRELRLSDEFFEYFHVHKREGQEIGESVKDEEESNGGNKEEGRVRGEGGEERSEEEGGEGESSEERSEESDDYDSGEKTIKEGNSQEG